MGHIGCSMQQLIMQGSTYEESDDEEVGTLQRLNRPSILCTRLVTGSNHIKSKQRPWSDTKLTEKVFVLLT